MGYFTEMRIITNKYKILHHICLQIVLTKKVVKQLTTIHIIKIMIIRTIQMRNNLVCKNKIKVYNSMPNIKIRISIQNKSVNKIWMMEHRFYIWKKEFQFYWNEIGQKAIIRKIIHQKVNWDKTYFNKINWEVAKR